MVCPLASPTPWCPVLCGWFPGAGAWQLLHFFFSWQALSSAASLPGTEPPRSHLDGSQGGEVRAPRQARLPEI